MISSISWHVVGRRKRVLELVRFKYERGDPLTEGIERGKVIAYICKEIVNCICNRFAIRKFCAIFVYFLGRWLSIALGEMISSMPFQIFLNVVVMMMEIFVVILFFTNSQQVVYFISVDFMFGMVEGWSVFKVFLVQLVLYFNRYFFSRSNPGLWCI